MIRFTKEQLKEIAAALREQIIRDGRPDEVDALGFTFVFSANVSCECETKYTGVEFLGARETYVKSNLIVRRLRLQGVYDSEGLEVETSLDPAVLDIDYDDDTVSVTFIPDWDPAQRTTKTAVTKMPVTTRTSAA